eukprot:1194831-Prorocentrum_minimum.AAC.6
MPGPCSPRCPLESACIQCVRDDISSVDLYRDVHIHHHNIISLRCLVLLQRPRLPAPPIRKLHSYHIGLVPLRWLIEERTPSNATATHITVDDSPADSPPTCVRIPSTSRNSQQATVNSQTPVVNSHGSRGFRLHYSPCCHVQLLSAQTSTKTG